MRDPVTVVSVLMCKPSSSIDAVEVELAIRSKLRPVTPDAGIPYKLDPSPINDPLITDAVNAPTKSIDPVFWVFVVIISSIEGPSEPDLAKNTFPSDVFTDNSPSCSCELFGTFPGTALLRSLTVCPIYMDLYVCFSGIYHKFILPI